MARRNADRSHRNGWNSELARCNQILGGLALAAGDTVTAGTHLTAAVAAFRDGDYLTELAEALPGLAACAQATGDLEAADRHLAEAITIATPRVLIPAWPPRWLPGPGCAPPRPPPGTPMRCHRAATTRTPRGGWRSATTCPGTNSTP